MPELENGRGLVIVVAIYLLAWIVHGLDHVRRGLFETAVGVQILGSIQIVLTVVLVWLLWRRHPWTPVAAVSIGGSVTLGISLAHLAPDFGAISDSLWVEDVDSFTWIAVLIEVIGSAGMTAVGWARWRARGFAVG